MRTVTLGGVPGRVVLGEGIPKTIVPLTASSLEALLAECAAAAECDIVEWRIDHFAGFRAAPPGDAPPGAPSSGGVDSILEAASHLTAAAGRPLLATFRTASEGGASAISPAEYEALLDALVRGGGVQAVDVEHFRAPGLTARVAEASSPRTTISGPLPRARGSSPVWPPWPARAPTSRRSPACRSAWRTS